MEIFHAEKGIDPGEAKDKKQEERIKMKEVEGYELPEFKYPDDQKEDEESVPAEVKADDAPSVIHLPGPAEEPESTSGSGNTEDGDNC